MKIVDRLFSILMVLILVFYMNFLFHKPSFAVAPFGAPIIVVTPCVNGLLLTVGPLPMAGTFLLPITPPPVVFPFYSFKPGSWVLGNFIPGGVCVIGPFAFPVTGTVLMVGTSI